MNKLFLYILAGGCFWCGNIYAATTTVADAQVVTSAGLQSKSQAEQLGHFIVRDRSIDVLLKGLSAQIKKPVIASNKAKKYQVTGNFDLNAPLTVLDKLASDLGLVWYYDGAAYYLYESSEMKSAVVYFPRRNYNDLISFLQKNGLYDNRYPLRMDYASNTIYLSGPPKYVDIITSIASFMGEIPEGDTKQQVIDSIKLKYSFVDDRKYNYRGESITLPGVASVISDLMSGKTAGSDKVTMQSLKSATGAPGVEGAKALFDASDLKNNDVRILPFAERNSLVVKGTREQVDMIKDLIASLDVPRRQLELSLWIIDIDRDDLDQLGVDWKGQFAIGSNGQGLFNTTSSIISGTQQNFFLATIKALSTEGKANIVSRPILLAQENIPALFDNSKSFYVKLIGERDVSLQTVSYGTTISVTPMISDDAQSIQMSLDIADGSTTADENGDTSVDQLPIVGNTTISTIARVAEGQSLLIGGYTRDQLTTSRSKIPLLGDIPFVGGLFRMDTKRATKSVRLFLIQPRVLSDSVNMNSDINSYIGNGWNAIEQMKKGVLPKVTTNSEATGALSQGGH